MKDETTCLSSSCALARFKKATTLSLDLLFRSVLSCVTSKSKKFKLLAEVFAYLLRGSFQAHDLYLVDWVFWLERYDGLSQFHNLPLSRELSLSVMKCMFELIDLLIEWCMEIHEGLGNVNVNVRKGGNTWMRLLRLRQDWLWLGMPKRIFPWTGAVKRADQHVVGSGYGSCNSRSLVAQLLKHKHLRLFGRSWTYYVEITGNQEFFHQKC